MVGTVDPALRRATRAVVDGILTPFVIVEAVRDDAGQIVDFVYVQANHAACAYNRLSYEQLVGARVMDLLPGHAASGLLAQYAHVVDSGEPLVLHDYPYDHELLGETRYYDIRAVRVGDGLSYSWEDVTARRQAMAALAASEARFRLLAENASDVVYLLDPRGVVTWISPSITAAIGWAPEELVGTVMAGLMHPDDAAATAHIRRALHEGTAEVESDEFLVRMRSKSGAYLWGSGRARTVRDPSGKSQGVIISARVVQSLVEAREAADAARRAADEDRDRLRLVMTTMQDPLVLLDPVRDSAGEVVDFLFADANPAAQIDNEGHPVAMIGRRMSQVLPEALHRATFPAYRRCLETGEPYRADDVPSGVIRPDGRMVRIDVRADRAGERLSCVWRNVTERHEAAKALAESELRYRLLAENASDIVYQTDSRGIIVWVAPSVTQALGHQPAEMVGTSAWSYIHPEDTARARAQREDFYAGIRIKDPRVRFRAASGEYRWMLVRSRPMLGEGGTPTGAVVGLRDITDEHEAHEELQYRAIHDPLTGLHNRAWILDMIDTDLKVARREGTRIAVLFVDLDNFKVVNDSLGHAAGDEVLASIARRIGARLRAEDQVGRFGGDEFVVIATHIDDVGDVEVIAEGLSEAISQTMVVEGHTIVPSASIGIALSDRDSTAASLLRDTDSALFRAKGAGRSRWQFFDQDMHDQAVTRFTIEAELRQGLARHEFVVHYQPIVRLSDCAVVGHEALVRWQHPTRGLLWPMDFLPVAEDSGLIAEIGDEVVDLVCALLAQRPDLPGQVSVNASPLQITRPGWSRALLRQLDRHGVDPHRICIEITETAALSILQAPHDDLRHLRDIGVGIHVDDFGTGFSSITLLRDLPVTGLKLDLDFTRNLHADPTARVLAAGLANMAAGLALDSVAEGIETPEQARMLHAQGWTHGQGYLFGRPAPEPALTIAAGAQGGQ